MIAEVSVPDGGAPATLLFSRPFFNGYQARLAGKKIAVESYRGLAPIVRLPAGSHGLLKLIYRPSWLVLGGAIALVSLLVLLLGSCAAWRERA